jgi:anhydro-N-acetylmuramic acid kinase
LFGDEFIEQVMHQAQQEKWDLHDLMCTATHFVARTVVEGIRRYLPDDPPVDRVFLSGGGVRNGLLWHLLQQQLAGIPLERTDAAGIPAEVRKAVSIGVLTALTADGIPANVPSATGAVGSRLLGSWTPGSAGNWARCLQWMAGQSHLNPLKSSSGFSAGPPHPNQLEGACREENL